MKTIQMLFFSALFLCASTIYSQDAKEIVQKAHDKMLGEKTSFSEMTMEIIRPTWSRSVGFKTWTKGTELSMTLITSPPKEKGQTFLKRGNEMWSWNPTIKRMIKLPPSMMSQGWMGSDYTNDDVVNQASIIVDYTHELIGTEKVNDYDCYKIQLIPKEDAPVVWGKIITWISKKEYFQMRVEFYDEDDELVRTENAYDIETFDGRRLPSRFDIIPADKPNQKTVISIDNMTFNKPIDDHFFSQQKMKTLR